VPHIVPPLKADERARQNLGIPTNALVFGRYGGLKTFDLEFVQMWVYQKALEDPNCHFLFMNTKRFCPPHPRIHHLRGTADPSKKAQFISACDAMLHAREDGETFGLAIGEFSVLNKPVLTWPGSQDAAHLEFLGDKALLYENAQDLDRHCSMLQLGEHKSLNWDCYSERFSPEVVTKQFKDVFLS